MTDPAPSGWSQHAEALAAELAAEGVIRDPAWRRAFTETPRHVFVPRYYLRDQYNQPRTLVDATSGGDGWQATYRNEVLVTHYRVAGTMPDGQEVRVASSSASMPSLVAGMLELAAVNDGHTVLEIGTGTGFHAALLCHRLGQANVTSVEVDPQSAAEAKMHLTAAGYKPTLVVGDGAAGYSGRAPYDRIIATCSVARVPAGWIEQLADGGVLVAPLMVGGALAVLRKTQPRQVVGRIAAERAYFMPLHAAGEAMPDQFGIDLPPAGGVTYTATTEVPPEAWAEPDWRLWLALHLPEGHCADSIADDGSRTGVIVYTTGRASVDYTSGEPGSWPITQDKARLWNTVETAWQSWLRYGRPHRTRIGITATSDNQFAWLDRPDGPVTWPLTHPVA